MITTLLGVVVEVMGVISGDDDGCVLPHTNIVAEFKVSVPVILKPMLDVILCTYHPHIPSLIVILMLSFL